MKVLVTGSAGFIGSHTVIELLKNGFTVVGLDNINDYYTTQIKYDRLAKSGIQQEAIKWNMLTASSKSKNYQFTRMNLEDKQKLFQLFQSEQFDYVINLAAQAGVRYSIENPDAYIQSNLVGFYNLIEACRNYPVKHLVHASSSSVYGLSKTPPFSEDDKVDEPISLYAATKKSNEAMAHAYSHLFNIPITCLRFFTVYGPWGRPDMAPMLFAKAIIEGNSIRIFNNGNMERDFTYISDIVTGVVKTLTSKFNETSKYRVLNIGNGAPVNLMAFVKKLELALGKPVIKEYLPMQPGDVPITWAKQEKLYQVTQYVPKVGIDEGVHLFASWYLSYFNNEE